MKLTPKATRFIIEALDHFQEELNHRLKQDELSEDGISDLINDRKYLEEIKQDLRKHQVEIANEHASVEANL